MIKNLQYILAITFFSLILHSNAQNTAKTLLWKIEKEGLKTSYLYGTIHVKDERVFDFPDSLLPIIERTEACALEVHPDSLTKYLFNLAIDEKLKELLEDELEVDYDDNEIKDLLGTDDYKKLNKKFTKEVGISLDRIKNRNPYLIHRTVGQSVESEKERPVFLDFHLYKLAKSNGMHVHGLESVTNSMNIYKNLNERKKIKDLKTLLRITSNKELGEFLLKLYTTADLDALDSLYQDSTFVDKEYFEELIVKRNYGMLKSIDSLIQFNSTFIAVGAAHLPGEEGLIKLLAKNGYMVSPVISAKTGLHKDFKLTVIPTEMKSITIENVGYSFKIPVEPFSVKIPYAQNDLKMGIDMTTGIIYMSMGALVNVEVLEKNEKNTLKNYTDLYQQRISLSIYESKDIEDNGCIGKEITYGFMVPMAKIRFYIRENKYIYLLGVTGENINNFDDKEIAAFFDSFETFPIQSKKWSDFKSEEGAFSVMFPGKPTKSNYTYNEGTEDELVSNIFIASDNSSGLTYIVNYFDIKSAFSYQTDSAYLCEIIKGSASELGVKNPQIIKDTRYGVPAYLTTINSNKIQSRILACLRGNRIYLLISAVQNKENYGDLDVFFNSFKFEDYAEIEWFDYKNEEYSFEIKLPKLPEKEIEKLEPESSYSGPNQIFNFILESKDNSTGSDFYINIDEFSQFHEVNDTDNFDFFTEQYVGYSDSLVSVDTISVDNRKAYDLVILNEFTQIRKRSRIFLDGNNLYALTVFCPKGIVKSDFMDKYFDSFHFTNEYIPSGIYSDKSKLIIDSICSTDSTTQAYARNALSYYTFDSTHIESLLSVLDNEFIDDSTTAKTRTTVFTNLSSMNDERITEYLIKNYKELPQVPELKIKALIALKNQKTEESTLKMVQFLLSDPPHPESYYLLYSITYQLSDSIELFKPYMPSLITLLEDSLYEGYMTQLLLLYLDSNIIDKSLLEPYINQVIENFRREEEKRILMENTGDYYYGYWQQANRLDFLAHFNLAKNFIEDLNGIVKNPASNYTIVISAINILLGNNIEIPKSVIPKIAKEADYAISLYEMLVKNKREDLFPKKLRNQEFFAKGDLYNMLESYDEYPDNIEFIKKYTVTENNKNYSIYMFKLEYSWEGESDSYVGFAGKYDNDTDKMLYNGDITGMSYDSYSKKNEDKIFNDYLASTIKEQNTNDSISNLKPNTQVTAEIHQENTKEYKSYHNNGKIKEYGTYLDNEKYKHCYVFEETGKIQTHYYYLNHNEEIVFQKQNPELLIKNPVVISDSVDIIAAAKGCESTKNNEKSLECSNYKLQEWLNERINLTKEDLEEVIETSTKIQLLISDKGKIEEIEFLSGVNENIRKRIIWSMKNFPAFEAAEKSNIKVGSKITLSIDCKQFVKTIEIPLDYTNYGSQKKNKYYDKGKNLVYSEAYEEAIEMLTKAIKKDPDNGHIYAYRSRAYFMLNKIDKALPDINKSLKLIKNINYYYFLRAQILSTKHMYKDAISDCDKALSLSMDDYLILGLRATLKMNIMDYEGALEDINKAIEIKPFDLESYLTRTSIYSHTMQYDLALDDLNTIIKIDTNKLSAYGSRAIINGILLDNYEDALVDLERVVKYSKDSIELFTSYNNFSMVYSNLEEYDKAIQYANKLLHSDHSYLAYNNRAYAKLKKGDLEGALSDVNTSLSINNKNCYAYRNKALILIAKEDYENACINIESAIKYGFTKTYGDEVEKLKLEHCSKLKE